MWSYLWEHRLWHPPTNRKGVTTDITRIFFLLFTTLKIYPADVMPLACIFLTLEALTLIKAAYYFPENRPNFPTTKGFRMKISMRLAYQYIAIFFNFTATSNHLHPLQVDNCDSNSRLVVDEDDNGKFRLKRVRFKRKKRPDNHGNLVTMYHCKTETFKSTHAVSRYHRIYFNPLTAGAAYISGFHFFLGH